MKFVENSLKIALLTSVIFGTNCKCNPTPPQTTTTEVTPSFDASGYLSQFGYLSAKVNKMSLSQLDYSDHVQQATTKFQQVFGLPVTGKLDNKTVELMKSPRCGNSDVSMIADIARKNETTPSLFRSANYVLADPPAWQLAELTYQIDMSTVPSKIRQNVSQVVKMAVDQWAAASGLKITPYDDLDLDPPSIKIKFAKRDHGDGQPFDGPGGVLAHAFFPNSLLKGEIHFDGDENWKEIPTRGYVSFPHVAIHELGHSLGLEHSTDNQAVMYPYFPAFAMTRAAVLTDDDRRGIKQLYDGEDDDPDNRVFTLRTTTSRNRQTTSITTATTSSRRLRTSTVSPDADRRSCSYLSHHHLQSIVCLNFDQPYSRVLFTVDNYIYRLNRDGHYQEPQFVADALPNAPTTGGRISSMISFTTDDPTFLPLYIFQKNLFWRYNVYKTIDDVPEDVLFSNTNNLNDLIVTAPSGYPKKIVDGFRGITAVDPVVFQLASDGLIYFLNATHYWTWSLNQQQGLYSNSRLIEEHPILASLPIRPPFLQSATFCGGKNYFFSSNGTYWSWLPDGIQQSYVDYNENYNDPEPSHSTFANAGSNWNPPSNTSRWFLHC